MALPLLLAQDAIHDPAPACMFPRLSAVSENVGIVAARFFQGIGQDRETVEGAFFVDAASEADGVGGAPTDVEKWHE